MIDQNGFPNQPLGPKAPTTLKTSSTRIEPTATYLLFGGAVTMACYGRESGDWSLNGSSLKTAIKQNPGIVKRITVIAEQHGVVIFSPVPIRFNARICQLTDLNEQWIEMVLVRGAYADGLVLRMNKMAFGLASADCQCIVARDPSEGVVIAAHAGLKSLISPGWFENGVVREYESVVDDIIAKFELLGARIPDLRAFVGCGITGKSYLHPVAEDAQGQRHKALVEYLTEKWGRDVISTSRRLGGISLVGLIRAQFANHGVPPDQVGSDSADTFSDKLRGLDFAWHSHRRDGDGTRNLVLVYRNW